MKYRLSPFVCFIFMVSQSNAAVITRCGTADGYAYYQEGGLVPKNKAGWNKDAITGGQYILLREGENFDIVFTDATKRTSSSREEGGQIIPVSISGGTYVILVNYPATSIETWVFNLDASGRGRLTFHQARFGQSVQVRKHSVMNAACER